jgi:hypothetical protein
MKFKFNKNYLIAFILLFLIEVCIAYFFIVGFIRHTIGDYIVVLLLYCFFSSFVKTKPIFMASAVLVIAYIIEFMQMANLLAYLNLENSTLAKTILGSTFQVDDLLAYTLGIISVLIYEYKLK